MRRITESGVQPHEQEHAARIRNLGAECTLLLKSDGTFPMAEPERIAVYGCGVRRTIKGGTGSGDVNVRHFTTVEEGLENAGFVIASKEWLDGYDSVIAAARKAFVEGIRAQAKALGLNPIMLALGQTMAEPDYEFALDAEAKTAIYVLSRNSGEGADRKIAPGDIELSQTEIRDILAANEKYEKFMLVLNTGGLVDLSPVAEVRNILLLGQLGTPTGDILADLLLGKSYPSGKLAMTWAPINAYCSTKGFGDMDDTIYHDGIYVGYRYFDTAETKPTYHFGYGLGYTEFSVEARVTSADEKQFTVEAEVKNIGAFPGKETVQVYVSVPRGKLEQPYQKLVGFQKTKELKARESGLVTICVSTTDLASYDPESASEILEKGTYVVRVGSASDCTRPVAALRLDETAVIRKLRNICPYTIADEYHPSAEAAEELSSDLPVWPLCAEKFEEKPAGYSREPEELPAVEAFSFEKVMTGERSVEEFAGTLNEKELASLCVGFYREGADLFSTIGAASAQLAGGAGETTALAERDVPALLMADGPAGIRVSTCYQFVDGEVRPMANPLAPYMEFLGEEELRQMAAGASAPPQEELETPLYYQYCTAIPIGTSLAQSWNPDILRACGDIVGEEMEIFGVHFWLAPALNIQRSPLCGRDFEYYSEDPLLSGLCAAAVVEGVEKHPGCATVAKHFACNNQETNRYVSNSAVGERALREIYLKAFEICLRTRKPHAVMTSYNLVNGEHSCNSKDLLTYVLRDEWGYEGLVMTDWYVTQDILASAGGRENNKYPVASAAGCVAAGNDLTMPGDKTDVEDILKALRGEGHPYPVSKALLQQRAMRVLEAVVKLTTPLQAT